MVGASRPAFPAVCNQDPVIETIGMGRCWQER